MSFDALLSGAAVVAAIAALLTYGWLLVRRFQMIRLAVTALIVAVIAQIASSLRTRPEWNGAERRTGMAHP